MIKEWNTFLKFLNEKSPFVKISLEKGNILEAPMLSSNGLGIKLAFPEEAHLIVEHLKDVQSSLQEYLSIFYKIDKEKISISMSLIGKKEAKDKNFKSKEQIFFEKKEQLKKEKKQMISSDPMVTKAEEIFHTKADNIILKDFNENILD